MDFLIRNLILNVRELQAWLGLTSIKASQPYLNDLEQGGIMREVRERKRNQLYRAEDVLVTIQKCARRPMLNAMIIGYAKKTVFPGFDRRLSW